MHHGAHYTGSGCARRMALLIILGLILAGCATHGKSLSLEHQNTSGSAGCRPDIYLPQQEVLFQTRTIGTFAFEDKGRSSDCSWEAVFAYARQQACLNGADAVRFARIVPPAFPGECYLAEAHLLQYLSPSAQTNTQASDQPQLRLGIGVQDLTPELAEYYGIHSSGVLVTKVLEGLPADSGGIQPQDIILEVNGRTVNNTQELQQHISRLDEQHRVTVKIWRTGHYRYVSLEWKNPTRPSGQNQASGPSPNTPPVRLKDTTPPVITIYEPEQTRSIKVNTGKYNVRIKGAITDPSGIAAADINGRPLSLDSQGNFLIRLKLTDGDNQVRILATDTFGNRAEKHLAIKRPSRSTQTGETTGMSLRAPRPTLWVLAIGISQYRNANLNLRFASHDAETIAAFFQQHSSSIYAEIKVKALTNERATRTNIIVAMERFLGQAAKGDVVLIFIAGHGIQHKTTGSYYFLTHNADENHLVGQALRWSDFDEMINILHQNVDKIILMLDTCHAGAIKVSLRSGSGGEDLAAVMRKAQGLYTLAASKAGEESVESDRFVSFRQPPGHGAFTYAILQGLAGEANYNRDDYISVMELFNYVGKAVPRLTQGRQHPYAKMSGTDMPLVGAE